MSIVVHRTFVHALLNHVQGDVSQIAKFRKYMDEGKFSYPEFVRIADTIIQTDLDDDIGKEGGKYYEEHNEINDRWRELAVKHGNIDFKRGIDPDWDAAEDAIDALIAKRAANILRECGEAELADLCVNHPKAYAGLLYAGRHSLDGDSNVIPVSPSWYGSDKHKAMIVFDPSK